MKISKRNGQSEDYYVEKIHKVVHWATEGLNGVSLSDIEMNANLSLYDGIQTSEIQQILIKSANDLISESNPNYQYSAARLLNMQLRKDVWASGKKPPAFFDFIAVRVDNGVYDPAILEKWSKGFDCNGYYSCEIGVREGLGSKIIMDNVVNNYLHIGIDPYGDLVYQHLDNQKDCQWEGLEKGVAPTYSDNLRDQLLEDFKLYIEKGKFTLSNITDTLFMTYPPNQDKKFAFVHFDGPHMTKDVITEAVWFANRSAPKTRFVFDDYPTYDQKVINEILVFFGFSVKEIGSNKILLEKNGD